MESEQQELKNWGQDGITILQQAEKEIYENITQCLCLARIQIASIELQHKDEAINRIGEASLLVGKAVKDLRNLAKQLTAIIQNLSPDDNHCPC